MNRFREFLQEKTFIRYSVFIVFNAFLLYVLYFIIKNMDKIAVGGYHILSSILAALSPLFIGLLIAYLLNPLVSILDKKVVQKVFVRIPENPTKAKKRKNLSRIISIALTFLVVLAILSAVLYGFAMMIVGSFSFKSFSDTLADVTNIVLNYEAEIHNWVASTFPDSAVSGKFMDAANSVIKWISDNFSAKMAMDTVTSTVGSVINIVLGIVISIYLMKDKDFFLDLWRKFLYLVLPKKRNAMVTETLSEINGILSHFIRGALLDALIVAILSSIGLSIIGLDFAVFIGVFAGIANVIPYFGPLLGMVPAFIMALLTGSFWYGVLAVGVLILIQQLDANLIYPRVVGSTTGLHPLVVLLAITVFGYFGGIIWMIIAVPIAGILQAFILKWVKKREKKIGLAAEPSSKDDS